MSMSESLSAGETFTVNQTWNGVPLNTAEAAYVKTRWLDNGDLHLHIDAPFANDPRPECENIACWELWNYEVVEIFLVGAGEPAAYTEVEISPWGNHLVLQLLGPRNTIARELPLELKVTRSETRWNAEAVLTADLIPKGDLRVNAYRVHGVEPKRQYHVMTPLNTEQPDFHRIDGFVKTLKR